MRGKTGRKLDEYIPAMLAKEVDNPFDDEDWIFEIKWDGYRALAEVDKKAVKLYSRNGNSFTDIYPNIVKELQKIKHSVVLDGEIVVLNEAGEPDFQKLQHYDANRHLPLQYYIFDLLELDGKKLYEVPLIERKAMLQDILPANDILKFSDHVEETGEDFFHVVEERNMEGIMAKRKSSFYYPGKRSADWLKVKHHRSDEAIIAGFTAPRGGRKYFGALVLGVYDKGKFRYIGHTGSGFDTKLLKEIYAQLQPLVIEDSPFDERVKTNMPVTWVKPELVCEMKFTEWTSDGKLRHPIFLRMRNDKKAADVNTAYLSKGKPVASTEASEEEIEPVEASPKQPIKKATKKAATKSPTPKKAAKKTAENSTSAGKKAAKTATADVVKNDKDKTIRIGSAEVKTTNRTKIFFPESGITKGDVIDYYERMADYILPYLKDRPESLFRTPNGINAKGFFHKDAGDEAPKYVKSISLYSDSAKKHIEYILCNNKASLLYLANLGCIEINPWHSRVNALDAPDYMIIDIDPSDNNTFDQVVEAALVVKEILDEAGAPSVCKTSGSSGLHIYVPMGKKYTYDQVKDFAYLVCMLANQQIPAFTTLERSLGKRRKDQIYMDYLQNRKGQTIASVYSLRPKPGATVSTPLLWEEVKQGLSPKDFTIFNIEQRVKEVGDLFKPVMGKGVDLVKCLQRLEGES
ncbi:DNA ligase D [Aridibaculum aurantiacum]|uniref:DNA ligase D n=1 Tax=Aridibaculum aurantiacum TaxID=2810307 RepID=UPI001A9674A6|nr:DNA ligase D [Aridibaculum aurantiacum]